VLRLEAPAFGRSVEVGSDVGRMHDLGQLDERRVPCESVLVNDALERAPPSTCPSSTFGTSYGIVPPSRRPHYLIARDVDEFGLRIDESPDEPWQAIRSTLAFSRVTHFMVRHSFRGDQEHDHAHRPTAKAT